MGWKPTCREVHRLISEDMDRPLSPVERLRMSLHLRICDVCSTFNRQMQLLRLAMRRIVPGEGGSEEGNDPDGSS